VFFVRVFEKIKTAWRPFLFLTNHLPRRNEIKTPSPPTNPNPRISKPMGSPLELDGSSENVGKTRGAGAV
jgi:hypothetical protein